MDTKAIIKKTGGSSLQALETAGGFMGASAVSKLTGIGTSLMGSLLVIVAGLGIAVFSNFGGKGYVFEKLLPNVGNGVAVYGTIKTLNNLSGDVVDSGVKGLGSFALPDSVKNFLREWTPQLTGTSLSGYVNGQEITMVQQPDGSYVMPNRLNGFSAPIYNDSPHLPELAGLGNPGSGGSVVLDVQI